MYIKDNKRFNPYQTVVCWGVTYQGNITSFPDAMAAMGITEIPDVPRPDVSDDTHFVFPLDEAPWWSVTPKSEEMIAQAAQAKLNATSLAYLASTDWYVTRFAETASRGTAVMIPPDVLAARQAARDAIVKQELPL